MATPLPERAWARRARISLARHLASAGRKVEAREVLTPVLDLVAAGASDGDNQAARGLLETLG